MNYYSRLSYQNKEFILFSFNNCQTKYYQMLKYVPNSILWIYGSFYVRAVWIGRYAKVIGVKTAHKIEESECLKIILFSAYLSEKWN